MQHEIFAVKDEKVEFRLPTADNCVSAVTNIVKLESIDAHVPRKPEPVVTAPDAPETKLDVKPVKETERTLFRSSQQAKIPLKKRDLKLAESFHLNYLNSSSIIVCNPMRNQTKGSSTGEGTNSAVNHLGQAPQESPPADLVGQERARGLIVGHVDVIRSSVDCQVVPIAKQVEHQVPCSGNLPVIAKEPPGHVRQQSVLVRNVPFADHVETVASNVAKQHFPKGEAVLGAFEKNKMFPSSVSLPQCTERPEESREVIKGLNPVQAGKEKTSKVTCDPVKGDEVSKVQEMEEGRKITGEGSGVGKMEAASVPPPEADGGKTEDQHKGTTQRLEVRLRSEETQPHSEVRNGPLVEASSELQKEGIRLKIKIPPHRRDKLRGKEGKEKERKLHSIEVCKPLRRSARICR